MPASLCSSQWELRPPARGEARGSGLATADLSLRHFDTPPFAKADLSLRRFDTLPNAGSNLEQPAAVASPWPESIFPPPPQRRSLATWITTYDSTTVSAEHVHASRISAPEPPIREDESLSATDAARLSAAGLRIGSASLSARLSAADRLSAASAEARASACAPALRQLATGQRPADGPEGPFSGHELLATVLGF